MTLDFLNSTFLRFSYFAPSKLTPGIFKKHIGNATLDRHQKGSNLAFWQIALAAGKPVNKTHCLCVNYSSKITIKLSGTLGLSKRDGNLWSAFVFLLFSLELTWWNAHKYLLNELIPTNHDLHTCQDARPKPSLDIRLQRLVGRNENEFLRVMTVRS